MTNSGAQSTAPAGSVSALAGTSNSATWHGALRTVHVLTAVALLGGDLSLLTLGLAGFYGMEPQSIYPAAYLMVSRLIIPLALVTWVTGVVLSLLTAYGLLRYWWVVIKLVTTTLLTLLVILVLAPGLERATELATMRDGTFPSAMRLRFAIAPAVAAVLLITNALLATYKPPWRLRAARTR